MSICQVTAEQMAAALTPSDAVRALRRVLSNGYDPSTNTARLGVPLPVGEMLVMPAALPGAAGIKILTVAPEGHRQDVPRIQGQYLLFDAETLAPRMLLDGAALTAIRTPAVSVAGVLDLLTTSTERLRVVILGTGTQGRAHEHTVREALQQNREVDVTYVSRRHRPVDARWCEAGSPAARSALQEAGLVVCATTASRPVLDRFDVRSDAVIVAVGSHSPDAREIGSDLMSAAQVIVEDVDTALAECGDVIQAVQEGVLDPSDLFTMRSVVRGECCLARDTPVVFKTSGMSWEDLVLAKGIADTIEANRE